MSTEIEAKFLVPDPGMARRIRDLPRLGSYDLGEPRRQRVRDHYFDTSSRALLLAGWACRVRRHDAGCLVTLKSVVSVSADVHRREELEVNLSPAVCLDGETLPPRWPASPARDKVLEVAGDEPVQPLFIIEQDRTVRAVMDGDRRVAVASLDDVRLQGGASGAWSELEVELSDTGTEADLLAMAGWIRLTLGLRPAVDSKFERALASLPP